MGPGLPYTTKLQGTPDLRMLQLCPASWITSAPSRQAPWWGRSPPHREAKAKVIRIVARTDAQLGQYLVAPRYLPGDRKQWHPCTCRSFRTTYIIIPGYLLKCLDICLITMEYEYRTVFYTDSYFASLTLCPPLDSSTRPLAQSCWKPPGNRRTNRLAARMELLDTSHSHWAHILRMRGL